MAKVNFCACNYRQYLNALNTDNLNSDTLYFVTPDADGDQSGNTGMICKGDVNVTNNVEVTDTEHFPAVADAIEGRFYVDSETFQVGYKSGDSLIILSPGYITDSELWVEADSGKLATINSVTYNVRAIINSMIGSVTEDPDTHVKVFSGLVNEVSYNPADLLLSIGTPNDTINIALGSHDIVGGHYDPEYHFDDHTGPALVLELANGSEIAIPAESLIDVYTAGNGITISGSNEISVKIDPDSNVALVAGADGVKATIEALPAEHGLRLAVIDQTNNILAESSFDIKATPYDASDSTDTHIPTTAWVTAAIQAIAGSRLTVLEETVNNMETIVNNFADVTPGDEETFAELDALTKEERQEKLASEELVYNIASTWGEFGA